METNYIVFRVFADGRPSQVIKKDLTLAEAQAHCNDKETSASTCTTKEGIARTKKYGLWMDMYMKV